MVTKLCELRIISASMRSADDNNTFAKIPVPMEEIKREILSLTNLIVYITVFSAVMNMPSLIARNLLMLTVNIQPEEGSTSGGTVEQMETYWSSIDWKNMQVRISDMCDILDHLLLFSSSHKFLIFIFKCNLIKIPVRRFCRMRCNLWTK